MQHYYRFRLRRIWRKTEYYVRFVIQASLGFTLKYIIRRTTRLIWVQRFIAGWLAIAVLIAAGLFIQVNAFESHYLVDGPRMGGTFIEGVVGDITSINPIFPESGTTNSATRLIFNGLVEYDAKGIPVGDLAKGWQVSEDGKTYTFNLRDDVFWHDGQPFTSDDVAFTFNSIQNPDVKSPLITSWQGIQINTPNPHTVVFILPLSYAPFIHSLTTGVLPSHLLKNITLSQLRVAEFNQQPIGTGPFKFQEVATVQNEIRLVSFDDYFLGKPRLDAFTIRSYDTYEDLLKAFKNKAVTGAGGFRTFEVDELVDRDDTKLYSLPLPNVTFLFFNTQHPLLKEAALRRAISQAVNPEEIVKELDYLYQVAKSPLLKEHLGYRKDVLQLPTNQEAAKAALEQLGWKLGNDGVREKDGQKLKFTLLTQNTDVYPTVISVLQRQLKLVGIDVDAKAVDYQDLQQNYVRTRGFDMLVFGIKLGADPDSFPYWHSSQSVDPGFNLSQYRNSTVDQALEAGRLRSDPALRQIKYEAFLRHWTFDVPAVALYRPAYFYAVRIRTLGIDINNILDTSDRLHNVENWTVRTKPELRRLHPEL